MTREHLEGALMALDQIQHFSQRTLWTRYSEQLAALPPEPDYRALLVECLDEFVPMVYDNGVEDPKQETAIIDLLARIRAALEGKNA